MYLWGLKLISRAVDNSRGMWALKGQTKIQSIRTNNHAVELVNPLKLLEEAISQISISSVEVFKCRLYPLNVVDIWTSSKTE